MGTVGCLLLLQLAAGPQDPVLVELRDGLAVTRAEYLEHLYAAIGGARLEELVLDRILAREVQRIDRTRLGAAARAALDEPERRQREAFAARLREQFGGDGTRWRQWLADAGLTEAEDRRATALQVLREDRLAAVAQARREPEPRALQRTFETHFGVDGVQADVRHVFVAFGRTKHELETRRPGVRATEAEVERLTRERMDAAVARLAAGAPIADVAAQCSEDPDARAEEPGLIRGYDFRRFGPEFATAVRALAVGETSAPFRSSHGWHVVRLERKETTRFDDVRARVLELWREEPPTLAERQRTIEALLADYGATRPLRR